MKLARFSLFIVMALVGLLATTSLGLADQRDHGQPAAFVANSGSSHISFVDHRYYGHNSRYHHGYYPRRYYYPRGGYGYYGSPYNYGYYRGYYPYGYYGYPGVYFGFPGFGIGFGL
jgi:hypothetical protein